MSCTAGASLKLVGPRGPVSAARLKFTSSERQRDAIEGV